MLRAKFRHNWYRLPQWLQIWPENPWEMMMLLHLPVQTEIFHGMCGFPMVSPARFVTVIGSEGVAFQKHGWHRINHDKWWKLLTYPSVCQARWLLLGNFKPYVWWCSWFLWGLLWMLNYTELLWSNVGKTMINHPPNYHFYTFPHGWFMALFFPHSSYSSIQYRPLDESTPG